MRYPIKFQDLSVRNLDAQEQKFSAHQRALDFCQAQQYNVLGLKATNYNKILASYFSIMACGHTFARYIWDHNAQAFLLDGDRYVSLIRQYSGSTYRWHLVVARNVGSDTYTLHTINQAIQVAKAISATHLKITSKGGKIRTIKVK